LPGKFKEADDTIAVFGCDGEGGRAVDGVANVAIVAAIVARFCADWRAD
jgi:hypothetical protein